jgi:hypothetical protein
MSVNLKCYAVVAIATSVLNVRLRLGHSRFPLQFYKPDNSGLSVSSLDIKVVLTIFNVNFELGHWQ